VFVCVREGEGGGEREFVPGCPVRAKDGSCFSAPYGVCVCVCVCVCMCMLVRPCVCVCVGSSLGPSEGAWGAVEGGMKRERDRGRGGQQGSRWCRFGPTGKQKGGKESRVVEGREEEGETGESEREQVALPEVTASFNLSESRFP